jgi:hypothetical protein
MIRKSRMVLAAPGPLLTPPPSGAVTQIYAKQKQQEGKGESFLECSVYG